MIKQRKLSVCYICCLMKGMQNKKTYRTILSVFLGVAILMGSTGFVLVSHECQHTGNKTYVISGNHGTEMACCEHEANSCCSDNHSSEPCPFAIMGEETCCEHESEKIQLPGFTITDKSVEKETPLLTEVHEQHNVQQVNNTANFISNLYPYKLPGKKTLLINCQFLA